METAKAVIEIKSDGHAHVLAGIIAFKNDVRFIYIIEQHYETFIQFFLDLYGFIFGSHQVYASKERFLLPFGQTFYIF